MSFQKFKEYLDDKGDLQKKPIVSDDGDTGPSAKSALKPPKAVTKGKNWKNFEASQVEDGGDGTKPTPYSAPGTDPGLLVADGGKNGRPGKSNPDPLSQKGDKNLIYNPKTDDMRLKMKKLEPTTPEDTKTEQFLNQTKGMSSDKYAEFVLKNSNSTSVKQIIETVDAIKDNGLLLDSLVRELKRKGGFEKLLEAVLDQPETYNEIACRLANESKGKETARQLARAINEIAAEATDGPATDDMVREKPASRNMPQNDSEINARGQAVPPSQNVRTPPTNFRTPKTVNGTQLPANTTDIQMSQKQPMMRPEHHLIEALAHYKSIKNVMKKLVD